MRTENFRKCRIEDLCEKVTSGGTPSRKHPEFYTGNIPWIKTGELKGWYINNSEEKITPDAIVKSSAKIYPINTVLMAMYGDGRTIGSVGITGVEAASNQACCAMIPNPKKCDPLFLFYSLHLHREVIVKLALGGAQRNLNQGTIKNYEISAPNVDEQKKIANVLAVYDNLIENNNRRIAILEEMAQSLYCEWFVNFRFPGHETTKFIDSPLGRIPRGWEVRQLKSLGEIVTGKTPSKSIPANFGEDIPFIKTPDMHNGIFVTRTTDMLSCRGADSQKNKYIPPNSILVSCIGTVGIVSINAVEAQTNQQINAIVLDNFWLKEYTFFSVKGLENIMKNYGSTGATMANLSKGKFESLNIVFPEVNLLKQFNKVVAPMFDKILNLSKTNKNLVSQRDLILPKLVAGKIRLARRV